MIAVPDKVAEDCRRARLAMAFAAYCAALSRAAPADVLDYYRRRYTEAAAEFLARKIEGVNP